MTQSISMKKTSLGSSRIHAVPLRGKYQEVRFILRPVHFWSPNVSLCSKTFNNNNNNNSNNNKIISYLKPLVYVTK